ncbi:hypothetical protein ACWDSD_13965 [Streptomyces spiralis]
MLDGDPRVVRINTATPAMQGIREEDVVGRTFWTEQALEGAPR